MAATFSSNRSHIVTARIDSWWVESSTDQAFYAFDKLYDGKVEVLNLTQPDSHGQPIPFGAQLKASAKVFNTDKANILKVLDTLGSHDLIHLINTPAGCIQSLTTVDLYAGFKWKFICDADSNKNRYVEIEASRIIGTSEITEMVATAEPSHNSQVNTDLLWPMAVLTRAGIYPAGFASVTICDTYNGSFLPMGLVMNGKLTIELLTQPDSLGKETGYAVKIDAAWDNMQASTSELAQLEDLNGQNVFLKIALLDGTVVFLGNAGTTQVGLQWTFTSDKDSLGSTIMKNVASGIILSTLLDGVFV